MKRVRPRSKQCICEWPVSCGGRGSLTCEGCGGDLCVCLCGGNALCPGCDDCEGADHIETHIEAAEREAAS